MSLLPEIREELMATAVRRTGTRRRRAGGGGLAVALGATCAVAVVVVAVVALGHRGAPALSNQASGSSLAALEAKLAILRRPQTPGDRTYSRYIRAPGSLIAKLARLATTVDTAGGRTRVYLLVRQRSRFASLVAVDPDGQVEGETGPVTAATLKPNAVGASGLIVRGIGIERNRGLSIGLVPDGVTRVKWIFTGSDFGVLDPHPVTVYPELHGNVAVASIRPDEGPLASAVWYGVGGRVIASAGASTFSTSQLSRIAEVNASRNRPIDPELIDHYRLFRSVPPVDLAADPLAGTLGSSSDLNYWQTRYLPSFTGLDGRGLWVTPGAHGVCIGDWNAGGCGTLTKAGLIGGSTSNGNETTFEGLVPDGNPTVTLVLANGTRQTFPVTDNVYEATVHRRVVAVIDRDIDGRRVRTALR